jgi:thermitase
VQSMQRCTRAVLALAVACLSAVAPITRPAEGSGAAADSGFHAETIEDGKLARAGSLIVTFRPGGHASARDDAHRQVRSQTVEPVGNGKSVRVQVAPGMITRVLSAYGARPDVQRVEPDYLVDAAMTPTDPLYGDEWGLARINAPTAWDRVAGASGVRVAVLDSGIANHPDLSGRVVLSQDFTGSPHGAVDQHGHGTHVAGTVAANANNGLGVVGVAWNASLLNAKVLADTGAGSFSTVANGIVWAADNGAKVISMSLGANLECGGVLQDAVDYAWTRGAVIVAAAGNSGMSDAHTPANCRNVVPVGAVNPSDGRPSYSNYGPAVPIAAPGDAILSTSYSGGYIWMSGTSMATSHTAGVAALIWASSYGTGNQAVVNRLFSTADRVPGTGSLWVHGRINAAAAVAGSPPGSSPPTPTVACSPRPAVGVRTARGVPGSLTVTVTAGATSSGANRLQEIRFGASSNAIVDVGTRAEAGGFSVTMPPSSASYPFTVRRSAPGTATTVPLVVVDSCGEWKTFVGGGPAAF